MRKFITSIGLAALVASVAGAQTLSPPFGQIGFDDGSAENSWKVSAPTATGDFFNVDFDAVAAGNDILAIVAVTNETGAGAAISKIGIYLDNLSVDPTGTTPDLSAAVVELTNPTGLPNAGFCTVDSAYDIPDFTHPATNVHVGFVQAPGDSVLWLCSDSNGTLAGRSYFTTNSYATAAIPFTLNWMLRMATPEGPAGTFLVNGSTTNAQYTEGDPAGVTLSFWGNAGTTGELVIIGAFAPSFLKVLNGITGSFPPGAADNVFSITAGLTCAQDIIKVDFRIDMGGFWGDTVNLKPNGKPRALATNRVNVTFLNNVNCAVPPACFGRFDDGILDNNIWKVQNPAGSQDWFNVDHQTPGTRGASGISMITAVEMASWDFCGATQSWANVGVYPDSTVFPGSGTPDVANPFGQVSGASATLAANAAENSYPATVYDFVDFAANSTTIYNAATQWNSADSCVWLGSDTDGVDDDATLDCGTLPNSTSFFTNDGYATAATSFTTANWMIKIDWN